MKKPNTVKVPLSLEPLAYTQQPQTLNVSPFDPDIHDYPGLYLEHQEGCGYRPYTLTPEEARKIAGALLVMAEWVEMQKWKIPLTSSAGQIQ